MNLPFTAEQFFDVFRRYNESVWPVQLVLNGIALITAAAACRANARRSWRWAQAAIVIPRFAIAIPVLWAGVGSYAAFGFRVHEDFGLIAAAITAIVVIHHATHRTSVARLAV